MTSRKPASQPGSGKKGGGYGGEGMAVDSHNSIDCNLRSEWAPAMLAVGIVGGGPSQAWLLRGIRSISSFNFFNIISYILHDSSCHDCWITIDGT